MISVTEDQKRQYVSDLYSGPHWKKKVDRMPDDQIVAIYLKHTRDGEFIDPSGVHDMSDDQEEMMIVDHRVPHPPHINEDDFPLY